MGTKQRNVVPLSHISLEDLVPPDHSYRQMDERLDLSFMYKFVRESYAKAGRPSKWHGNEMRNLSLDDRSRRNLISVPPLPSLPPTLRQNRFLATYYGNPYKR